MAPSSWTRALLRARCVCLALVLLLSVGSPLHGQRVELSRTSSLRQSRQQQQHNSSKSVFPVPVRHHDHDDDRSREARKGCVHEGSLGETI